jgi:hypothetical protein
MIDTIERRDGKGLDEERRQRGPELDEESEHEGAAEEALAEDE